MFNKIMVPRLSSAGHIGPCWLWFCWILNKVLFTLQLLQQKLQMINTSHNNFPGLEHPLSLYYKSTVHGSITQSGLPGVCFTEATRPHKCSSLQLCFQSERTVTQHEIQVAHQLSTCLRCKWWQTLNQWLCVLLGFSLQIRDWT